MHIEILNDNQRGLLPFVKQFKREFYLVEGIAGALHLGHRRSVDFDLFKPGQLRPERILQKISSFDYQYNVTRRVTEQLNVNICDVKFTFYQFPFTIPATEKLGDYLRLPELIDLAAMKAYALGRSSKWKDYVDIYYILKDHYSVKQICERASIIFGQLFSEKLFRAQLCYFDDIDYSESVEFLLDPVPSEVIKNFLSDKASDIFDRN